MIAQAPFGRTGHQSSRTLFGGAALWSVTQPQADRVLDLLLAYGVNHIDTAASYGDSERRIGPWMARYRDHFFLATKTEQRTYQGARDELHRSLERLQTDHVDLWQMHLLVDSAEWRTAMGPGGALEAFIEARQQGLVRHLGVTGHGVTVAAMHRRSLERHPFDSVLLPYNPSMMQNPAYAAEFEALLATCALRGVAVQTIKTLARGPWGDRPRTRTTWYAPLEDPAAITAAVHWVLRRPGLFVNTVGDIDLLPHVLAAADAFDAADVAPDLDAHLAALATEPLFT